MSRRENLCGECHRRPTQQTVIVSDCTGLALIYFSAIGDGESAVGERKADHGLGANGTDLLYRCNGWASRRWTLNAQRSCCLIDCIKE